MNLKVKRDRSEEIRPQACRTPSSNIIDLIRKLNETKNGSEEAKIRANSLKRMEETKNRILLAKPPIGRKPSPGLNATDELKLKLPPKAPLSAKTASASSLKAMINSDDIIGTGNFDNYIVGGQIGQGAYAVVRSAMQKGLNKKVAIKTYEKSKLLDPHRKRCVKREIDVLEILDHPNIVKLYEVINTSKHLHLSMEYIGGNSLHSYLKRRPNRKLEESEVRRIYKQVLQAIDYCHSKNVTHRDIKLENILLDDENNVKIIDFGFATCFPHDKKVKLFCGTPSYMAPEIVNKVEYSGPPVDVWALGVLLYVLVCGTYPFKAHVDTELYKKIQFGQFTVPCCISQGSRSLISRILRLNPDKRPTVSEILKDAWILSGENPECEVIIQRLPKSSSTGDPFDAEIIFSLKKFGYTEEELKIDLQNERSRASLLYRHLKKSKDERSIGSITGVNNMSAGFG